jgi:hypothetical protein
MLKLTVYHLPSGSRKNGNMWIHLLYKESELHHIHQHYKLLRTAHKVLALRLSYQLTNKQTNALRHWQQSLLVPHVIDDSDSLGHSTYKIITISNFTYSIPCIMIQSLQCDQQMQTHPWNYNNVLLRKLLHVSGLNGPLLGSAI